MARNTSQKRQRKTFRDALRFHQTHRGLRLRGPDVLGALAQRIAAPQNAVITWHQLPALGVSADQIVYWVATGL